MSPTAVFPHCQPTNCWLLENRKKFEFNLVFFNVSFFFFAMTFFIVLLTCFFFCLSKINLFFLTSFSIANNRRKIYKYFFLFFFMMRSWCRMVATLVFANNFPIDFCQQSLIWTELNSLWTTSIPLTHKKKNQNPTTRHSDSSLSLAVEIPLWTFLDCYLFDGFYFGGHSAANRHRCFCSPVISKAVVVDWSFKQKACFGEQ